MSAFEFISHENFPYDEYTKEAVVLCIEGKYRVTYVRKSTKHGGMFWDVVSFGAKQSDGTRKILKGFAVDSNFLQDDIKNFLDSRSWEKGGKRKEIDEVPF